RNFPFPSPQRRFFPTDGDARSQNMDALHIISEACFRCSSHSKNLFAISRLLYFVFSVVWYPTACCGGSLFGKEKYLSYQYNLPTRHIAVIFDKVYA
ncbi:hypothetical protein, partial [Treponema endosymbiont of Eucomonympha sp.]|uniref:hypothetical protein n=1 Tax=Treponema endosymbiont of Eucomonympha sp. TaxID=1580831 RepID=UPI001E50F1EA